jgi:hypothetical protein
VVIFEAEQKKKIDGFIVIPNSIQTVHHLLPTPRVSLPIPLPLVCIQMMTDSGFKVIAQLQHEVQTAYAQGKMPELHQTKQLTLSFFFFFLR